MRAYIYTHNTYVHASCAHVNAKHACTCIYTHGICTHILVYNTCTCTHVLPMYMHTCTHVYTDKYMHIYIYTFICIYMA